MSELFAVFAQNLLWSVAVWLVVFIGFAAIFARGQLLSLAKGLGRLLLSIVTSPFVFLRRATGGVLGFTAEEEETYRAGDQYMLSKAMMVLQAAIIIAAIGALAAAVVATWNTLVPPSAVRQAAREHRPRVEEQHAAAAKAAQAVSSLDAAWATRQPRAIEAFRNPRQTTVNSSARDMAYIETTMGMHGAESEKAVLKANQERAISFRNADLDNLGYGKRVMDSNVARNWYALEDWSRASLSRWNELWLTKAIAELELREMSVVDLRRDEQPDYESAVANRDRQAQAAESMVATQARLDEAASLKWKSAAFRAGASFLTFLLFVWTAGLLVEAGWLAIRVAGDVRRLRESADAPPPVVHASVPAGDTTVREARLPIRESAVQQAARS